MQQRRCPLRRAKRFFAAVDARLVGIRRPLTDDDVNAAIVSTLGDSQTHHDVMFHVRRRANPRRPTMAKNYDDDDDDNPFDERGILKDGHKVRISLQMRDAATCAGRQRPPVQRSKAGSGLRGDRSPPGGVRDAVEAKTRGKCCPNPPKPRCRASAR